MFELLKNNKSYLELTTAVLSLVVLVVLIFGGSSQQSSKASDLVEIDCGTNKIFYSPIEPYPEDQKSFSENAKAFKLALENRSLVRVISDFSLDLSIPQSTSVRVGFVANSDIKIDFSAIDIYLKFNDGRKLDLRSDIAKQENNNYIFEDSIVVEKGKNIRADLIIEDPTKCLGKIPDFLVIADKEKKGLDNFKPSYKGIVYFGPGYTQIGFLSWMDLKKITEKGLTVAYYSGTEKEWILNPQNESFLAKPNTGYYVFNPSSSNVKVEHIEPFYVPEVETFLEEGWNFLHNSSGNDRLFADLEINNSLLSDFLKEDLVGSEIYFIDKEGDLEKEKITDSLIIPDGAFYWLYLKEAIGPSPKDLLIDLELQGGGDTYKIGSAVPISLKLRNDSSLPIKLSDPTVEDHCQVGFSIYDELGSVITQTSKDNCPKWPKQIILNPGDDVTYNYTWISNVKGKISVKSSFNFARVGISNIVYNEIKFIVK